MARYKLVDRSPRFLPIVLEAQLIPGSFEHALDVLVDTEIDVSRLAKRFCNDETGAPAFDPVASWRPGMPKPSSSDVRTRHTSGNCKEEETMKRNCIPFLFFK